MRRRTWCLAGLMAVGLSAPTPSEASIFSAFRALARLGKSVGQLGKAARGAGAVGKLAKGAAVVGGVAASARAARHVGRVSKVVVAERAAVLFARLPDDVGQGAALLAREGDTWHLARLGTDVDSAGDMGRLVAGVDNASASSLFVDPSAGLRGGKHLPAGARFTDATGSPRPWRLGRAQDGRMRAWPEPTAGDVLDAALDATDLATLGWDIAQVSFDLGVNGTDAPPDPRGLKLARVGKPCDAGEADSPVPWRVDSLAALEADLAEAEPSRLLVFTGPDTPGLSAMLDRQATQNAHTMVSIQLPDTCDHHTIQSLLNTARQEAMEGDRLPLVMVAPLDATALQSEDPLRFCGDTTLPGDVPVALCWAVPTVVPTDPEPAADELDDPMEPPLWLYGVALLISIPVLIVMKRMGKLDPK